LASAASSANSEALHSNWAADLISTSFCPNWDEVGRLEAIAAIRTFLSYFLDREVESTSRLQDKRQSWPLRTSLWLIGFGFTIYQVFAKLLEAQVLRSSAAPRRFGEALVFLGICNARPRHRLSHRIHD
jgi:Protein of unknown function (DUF1622)